VIDEGKQATSDSDVMHERKIQESLERIEQRLRNAEEYVARNENVEGASFLHLRDWEGKSGHPLWMQHWMLPTTKRERARKERARTHPGNREGEENPEAETEQGVISHGPRAHA
jgi:hypothetical protein